MFHVTRVTELDGERTVEQYSIGRQARSETRAWGGVKIAKWNFFSLPRAGGPNLEKVDKIYTRGEKFSKKGHFD